MDVIELKSTLTGQPDSSYPTACRRLRQLSNTGSVSEIKMVLNATCVSASSASTYRF